MHTYSNPELAAHLEHDWCSVSRLQVLGLTDHAIQLDRNPSALKVDISFELEAELGVVGVVGWVGRLQIDWAVLRISLGDLLLVLRVGKSMRIRVQLVYAELMFFRSCQGAGGAYLCRHAPDEFTPISFASGVGLGAKIDKVVTVFISTAHDLLLGIV